jgi:hypothetical protein
LDNLLETNIMQRIHIYNPIFESCGRVTTRGPIHIYMCSQYNRKTLMIGRIILAGDAVGVKLWHKGASKKYGWHYLPFMSYPI